MEENDKKDLVEAVEKIINKNEEKKRASMRTSPDIKVIPIKEKHLVKKAPLPEKKKIGSMVLLIVIITCLSIHIAWDEYGPEEVEPEIVIVYPANVVLTSFDDGATSWTRTLHVPGQVWPLEVEIQPVDDYVSVTFKLKNTGDEVAMDVSCFVKCCDQNGTILFAQMFTFGDIGLDIPGNIPVMKSYRVPITDEVIYITHNIEIQWSPQGVNTYTKLTEV